MGSSESHSGKGLSQPLLKTDIVISETLNNTDWCNNPLRLIKIFDYIETQKSKLTQIQCYSCDKKMELNQFNKNYIHYHTKENPLKYSTNKKMRYDAATKSGLISNNESISP